MLFEQYRNINGSYIIKYCNAVCFLAVFLVQQTHTAYSAVFEQGSNGLIANFDGGVPVGTPPQISASHLTSAVVTGSAEDGAARPAGSSVILNIGRAVTNPVRANAGLNPLKPFAKGHPKPRLMSASLSGEQERMRALTMEVANAHSNASGVARSGLDREAFVALFTTLIHRESNFIASAVSHAGARGLGQLMPSTARELGVCDAFSARENLEGSVRYLTQMLDRFASPALALAAYNAGPGAVDRHRGIPPYRETTQYVADIVYAAAIHAKRAPLHPATMELADDNSTAIPFVSSPRCTRT